MAKAVLFIYDWVNDTSAGGHRSHVLYANCKEVPREVWDGAEVLRIEWE